MRHVVKGYQTSNGDTYEFQGAGITYNDELNSIAIGEDTVASGENQFVFGKYNKEDQNKAEIVGGGEIADNRIDYYSIGHINNITVAWGSVKNPLSLHNVSVKYLGLLSDFRLNYDFESDNRFSNPTKVRSSISNFISYGFTHIWEVINSNFTDHNYIYLVGLDYYLIKQNSDYVGDRPQRCTLPLLIEVADNGFLLGELYFIYDSDFPAKKATYINIRTLDWQGNQWNAGDVTCDDGNGNTISLRQLNTTVSELENTTPTGEYAPLVHNHDDRYALKDHTHSEYLTEHQDISGKADVNHNHDTTYAAINHNHDGQYSSINHSHGNSYAAVNHMHTSADIFDKETSYPSNGSTKLITSGAVYSAIQGLSGGQLSVDVSNKIDKKGSGYENYIAFFDENGDLKKISLYAKSNFVLKSALDAAISRISILEEKVSVLTKNKYTGADLLYSYTNTLTYADKTKLIDNLPAGTYTSSATVTGIPSTPSELNGTCLIFVNHGKPIQTLMDSPLYEIGSTIASDIIAIANWGDSVTTNSATDVYVVCITKTFAEELKTQAWSGIEYTSSGTINIEDIKIQDVADL